MTRHGLALPLIFAAAAGGLHAQASDSTLPPQPASRRCFGGQPEPVCHSFAITEFGLAREIGIGGGPYQRVGTLATWELGFMVNQGSRHALGVAAFAHLADFSGIGIRPRFRTWLSPYVSVDIAPGIILNRSMGFSGQVALNLADYAAVTSQLVVLPKPYGGVGGPSVRLYLGVKLGSLPGAITGIATPLVAMLAFIAACSRGCD